jgi:hypothetical protein
MGVQPTWKQISFQMVLESSSTLSNLFLKLLGLQPLSELRHNENRASVKAIGHTFWPPSTVGHTPLLWGP